MIVSENGVLKVKRKTQKIVDSIRNGELVVFSLMKMPIIYMLFEYIDFSPWFASFISSFYF